MTERDYDAEAWQLAHDCIGSGVNYHDACRAIAAALRATDQHGDQRGFERGVKAAREAGRRELELLGYYPHARRAGDDVLRAIDALLPAEDSDDE